MLGISEKCLFLENFLLVFHLVLVLFKHVKFRLMVETIQKCGTESCSTSHRGWVHRKSDVMPWIME